MPTTFNELEREQYRLLKEKHERDMDCVSCPKCESQWFEEVQLSRFKADHHLVLGQDVPPRPGTVPYRFLRCAVCNNIVEPRVQSYGRDLAIDDYNLLLDTLDGKFDTRKKEEVQEHVVKSEEC